MRIISGKYGRRVLRSPANGEVRPTTDRVKETIFNILSNKIDFEGIKAIDLYCGSGSLGLECISRGASEVLFVDINTENVRKNIEILGVESGYRIIRNDVLKFLQTNSDIKMDLILADPPYKYNKYSELISMVSVFNCYFVIEYSSKLNLPIEYSAFLETEKKTGISKFSIYNFKK